MQQHRAIVLTLITAIALATFNGTESQNHTSHGHRSKRWLFINPDASITLGFLLNMPLSLTLPTLVDVNSRSLKDVDEDVRLPGQEYPDGLFWEPSYEQELGTLQVYFSYLKVPTVACQERMVCELAGAPDTYTPLSTLVLKELRQTHGPVKPSLSSLFWRFMAAFATGYAYSEEDCAEYYPQCGVPAKRQLNLPVLKVWQYLADTIELKFV